MALYREPLVSVIVTAFNSERFITDAIESVKSQSYKNWEILVIDDCSTDRTLELCEQQASGFYKDRIKIFRLSCNSGLPAVTRNFGMRKANGEYIAFLDSDDLWLPDKLFKQVSLLEENNSVYLCYARAFLKSGVAPVDNNRIYPNKEIMRKGRIFNYLFLSKNFIPCLTVLIRNKGDEKGYYFDEDKRLRANEDHDLWLRISLNEEVDFIEEPLGIYRMHENHISKGLHRYLFRSLRLAGKWKKNVSTRLLIRKYIEIFLTVVLLSFCKVGSLFRDKNAHK